MTAAQAVVAATATVAEVKDKALLGEPELWLVTLTDIEPVADYAADA